MICEHGWRLVIANRSAFCWLLLFYFVSLSTLAAADVEESADAEPTLTLSAAGAFQVNNDATLRRLLKDAQSRLKEGQLAEGLARLQAILDRGDDAFVKLESRGPRIEVRLTALKTLSALGRNERDVYEKLFGSHAKQLFSRAKQTGRSVYAAEVVRKYFHTQAGGEAAKWLAARWLERGDAKPAVRMWERLLSDALHGQNFTLTNHVQIAVAHQLLGNESHARELLERSGTLKLEFSGEMRTATQAAELLSTLPRVAFEFPDSEWRTAGGGVTRHASARGSTPWLVPQWSASLFANQVESTPVELWRQSQESANPPQWVTASEPLVVRQQVVVRDFQGVSAFDARQGRRLWRYRSAMLMSDVVHAVDARSRRSDGAAVADAVQEAVIGNMAWGTFSTDGRLLFAVDYLPTQTSQDALNARNEASALEKTSAEESPGLLTQLIALPLVDGAVAASEVQIKPQWKVTGSEVGTKLAGTGHAVHFLGSPTVVDGALYVIGELYSLGAFDTEKVGQLSLFALDAETGELLWSQGLALVDQPFFRASAGERRRAIGSPSFADGMLVCATEVGLIVGVDLVTGRQRWVYDYRSDRPDFLRTRTEENLGWDGLPSWPVIHRGRVYLLPRSSEHLHCLDLATGRPLWKVDRGDALCVGTVTDESIVLVGVREVRAISRDQDGKSDGSVVTPLWSRKLGLITGRGVRVGDRFLLPLRSGRVANLDLTNGQERGFSLRRLGEPADSGSPATDAASDLTAWPGNLIVAGDSVLSLGPTQLVAYPQAGALLASSPVKPETVEQQLRRSELAMLLGNDGSPVAELERVLEQPLTTKFREQAERQLRESLYLELDRTPQEFAATLKQLERLARTPLEKGRLWRRQCELTLRSDPAQAVDSAQRLAELAAHQELELDELGEFAVSHETWARSVLRQVKSLVEINSDHHDRVLDLLSRERNALRGSRDVTALRRFVHVYDDWPQAAEIRLQLADLMLERGEFQEAELLLIRDRRNPDPRLAASATERLQQLWSQLGWHALAGGLLEELDERFDTVELLMPLAHRADGGKLTGREYVAAFPRDHLTWHAFARRERPIWEIRRVAISEQRAAAGELTLLEAYDQRRRSYTTHSGMAVQLIEKPLTFGPKDESAWQIVDKDTGVVAGQLNDMERVFYPTSQPTNAQGVMSHFLPLGGPARFRGVSLLEPSSGGELWEQVFPPLRITDEFPRVGPCGPGFCVFQSRQHLVVLDPVSGKLLWRRGNLEPQSGLFAENEWGLFGDREALVMFSQDYLSYVVYETATGQELRRGRLNADLHQNRRVFGRKLFYFSDEKEGRRLCLWDPLRDQLEINERIVGRPLPWTTPEGELALVFPSGQVRIIDVHAGLVKLDASLPQEFLFGVNAVRVFSDHDRYFVNLQRAMLDPNRNQFNYYVPDLLLPRSDMQGEIYAFARPATPEPLGAKRKALGKRLWSRVIPQRTFLRPEQTRLPFLVVLSRQQDRQNNSKSSIRVEAIDASTGDLLGSLEHVLPGRFAKLEFDIARGHLTLKGTHTHVLLDFSRERQGIPTEDELY